MCEWCAECCRLFDVSLGFCVLVRNLACSVGIIAVLPAIGRLITFFGPDHHAVSVPGGAGLA